MRGPFRVNTHQDDQKRNRPHSGGHGELCIDAASGRRPLPPCSPSRLVALSRCPDALYILAGLAARENSTMVSEHPQIESLCRNQRPTEFFSDKWDPDIPPKVQPVLLSWGMSYSARVARGRPQRGRDIHPVMERLGYCAPTAGLRGYLPRTAEGTRPAGINFSWSPCPTELGTPSLPPWCHSLPRCSSLQFFKHQERRGLLLHVPQPGNDGANSLRRLDVATGGGRNDEPIRSGIKSWKWFSLPKLRPSKR